MFRHALPVAIYLTQAAGAETLGLPVIGREEAGPLLPACVERRFSQENCVRVLACVGDEGLWFDGQARGWEQGLIQGFISDGTPCAGTWNSNGFLGTGFADVTCQDDTTMRVIYHTQDGETGTVIGSGRDSQGRAIRAWSGLYVLDFLRGDGDTLELPCGPAPVPIG